MKREELWKIYIEKNPSFLTDGANFTAKGLRDFFERTFDQGFIEGKKQKNDIYQGSENFYDIFSDFLSKKR